MSVGGGGKYSKIQLGKWVYAQIKCSSWKCYKKTLIQLQEILMELIVVYLRMSPVKVLSI